jgi:hypothetical protein
MIGNQLTTRFLKNIFCRAILEMLSTRLIQSSVLQSIAGRKPSPILMGEGRVRADQFFASGAIFGSAQQPILHPPSWCGRTQHFSNAVSLTTLVFPL